MADTSSLFTDAARERLAKTAQKHVAKMLSRYQSTELPEPRPQISIEAAVSLCLDPETAKLILETAASMPEE
jgi:hypothetical protein